VLAAGYQPAKARTQPNLPVGNQAEEQYQGRNSSCNRSMTFVVRRIFHCGFRGDWLVKI
jgi:hypothetical protein